MRHPFSPIVLSLALATGAHANLITLTGSIDQAVIPAGDDYGFLGIYLGREVILNQESQVTFKAIFSEAAYTNALITFGDVTYSNVIDGASTTEVLDAGLIPFSFFVTDTSLAVSNGTNQAAWTKQGPQPHFAITEEISPGKWLIGLQDDGNSIDYDFDDYVIEMTVEPLPVNPQEVPEPLPAALLGLGLLGVGLTRLRRRSM